MDRNRKLFGRFWNGKRPEAEEDYTYGFCNAAQSFADRFYFLMGTDHFEKFEQASEVPKFEGKKRRLRIDRGELVSILMRDGFVPDPDGDFVNDDSLLRFPVELWSHCGEELDCSRDRDTHFRYYTFSGVEGPIMVLPEWTEEYEEENI